MLGQEDWGEVQFLLPVDVRGMDLDSIVSISKGRMQVYGLPGGPAAPGLGSRLNVPAMLTFRYAGLPDHVLIIVVLCVNWIGVSALRCCCINSTGLFRVRCPVAGTQRSSLLGGVHVDRTRQEPELPPPSMCHTNSEGSCSMQGHGCQEEGCCHPGAVQGQAV